jgi:endonuclease-3 related protein
MPTRAQRARIQQLAAALDAAYGPQHWWPAETRFEVLLGAILTQNTAWSNVEKALEQLRGVVALEPETILHLSREDLAQAIRPAGYFNQKAARIHGFCAWFVERGGFAALDHVETLALRAELLALHGIGPETADDMVLYAFDRPVFVVDAYTHRLLQRYLKTPPLQDYEAVRGWVEEAFVALEVPERVKTFNELHAQIVRHAKVACRKRNPDCASCAIQKECYQRL